MDIGALERRAANALARSTTAPANGRGSFASRLASSSAASSLPTDLEGARVSPPPGGCACDAMAATANPAVPARPMPTVDAVPGRSISISPASVKPGDLLLLDAVAVQADRLHLAIVRNAREMLAPDPSGVVIAQPIPWNQVRGIRRPV